MKGATSNFMEPNTVTLVSIRAPREGGDRQAEIRVDAFEEFQSAPPVKGATYANISFMAADKVSIRAPREGGDQR